MAQTVCVVLSGSDKARLETIVADRNQQQKDVERTRAVLASPEGLPVQRVERRSASAAVQRIWKAHKLQPHRVRTFKRSRDPEFAAKLTDIVGLYMTARSQACRSNRAAAVP
jgi:hypothetical protein